ncbi:MAG TPA: phosphoglucosamine mutase [Chromatiales bacterium]|nr:phosphoglucosamine mutase [Thiotrichales bacterium]HIP68073.1 phosphoglucosamine mutase [Chromatiales bacterium]
MSRKYFGTDGVRGRVGAYPMTPEFVLKLGWAAGRVLANDGRSLVLIGKDTRISGYMMESVLEAGLSAAGVDSRLLGPMPTPAIAYLTRTLRASAGIVISASHNPYYDNGIKFFSADGTKLPDEIELAIEAEMDKPMEVVGSADLGKAERVEDATGRYIEFCKSTIPSAETLHGLKLVVDCANGATYQCAPAVFAELGAEVISIGDTPDGLNINADCGATAPQQLREAVLSNQADLGVALDGDGDRLIMVDHKGEIVDGDESLFILAQAWQREDQLGGGVIGTQMSNLGLELALRDQGVGFERAKVGDRYVMEELLRNGWTLGGESSGHIICLDRTTTGDGIVSALQVLHEVVHGEQSLHELKQGMMRYPQTLINVRLEGKIDLGEKIITDAVNDVESELADQGRVLLRESGTEPLVRVMVEGQDTDTVARLAEQIAGAVKAAAEQAA